MPEPEPEPEPDELVDPLVMVPVYVGSEKSWVCLKLRLNGWRHVDEGEKRKLGAKESC